MAKHEVHEEHENHERWLVSYADFMTLLFALFVVLYAMSSVDTKKVRQVEVAVRWALHIEGEGGGGELPAFSASARLRRSSGKPAIASTTSAAKARASCRPAFHPSLAVASKR